MTPKTKPDRSWFQNNRLLWGLILIVFFSLLRFFQVLTWERWFGTTDFIESGSFVIFLLIWFILLAIGLIVGGVVWLTKTSWQGLGWKSQGLFKSISMGLIGFVLLYLNTIAWAMLTGNTEQPEMFVPSLTRFLIVLFFAFGLPAWVEENLFRGYLQPLLVSKMNLWLAIVVQAAIFSLAHFGYANHIIEFGSLFSAGLILGILRKRDSNLIAPYIAHGLFWMMGAFMVLPQ